MIFFDICLSIEFIFLSFIYIHFFNLLKLIFQIFNNNILNIKKYPLFISPYNDLNFIFLFSLKLKRLPL
jgi:hypothetical protein